MSWLLVFEQSLNALQLGLMLFLLAAGLTLVFGIMDMINLAHGALYMIGAFLAASLVQVTGSFWLGVLLAMLATAAIGALLEFTLLRRLYQRDHLSQVLATFALILISNEIIRMIWGPQPVALDAPPALSGAIAIFPGLHYSAFRLVVIIVGLAVALLLYLFIGRTRVGMWVRAGASNRDMARAMGVNVKLVFTVVFALGAALCALAGAMLGPLLAVQVGMGESILILAFVVTVIGGIGSIRGAFAGALLVGLVDTFGRAFLPMLVHQLLPSAIAADVSAVLASIAIYVLMAAVLFWRPQGLFPAHTQ